MFAVISDIHSNIEALEVVFKDIEAQNIKTVYCLGDIVGYGPNPIECTRLIKKKCEFSIVGNHDYALIQDTTYGFNSAAKGAIDWTHKIMKPGFWSFLSDTKDLWKFLEEMKEVQKINGFHFVHGSPLDPIFEYITYEDAEDIGFGYRKDFDLMFDEFEHICFNGHTHRPLVISQEGKTFNSYKPEEIDDIYQIKPGEKALINAGSVGQPRDGNTKASYLVIDDDLKVHFKRLDYSFEDTAKKIYENPSLDKRLGDRLKTGT